MSGEHEHPGPTPHDAATRPPPPPPPPAPPPQAPLPQAPLPQALPPQAPPPQAPPLQEVTRTPLRPTGAGEREPILDALRGFALLGILLINVQLMRGPDIYLSLAGTPAPASTADQAAAGVLGLLAAGKFLSSFALLFGVGAAIITQRALERGWEPRPVLARRYAWLLAFGLAHMVLLFPGDILLLYGLTGLVLLAFVTVSPRTAAWWGAGIIGVIGIGTAGLTFVGTLLVDVAAVAADDPMTGWLADLATEQADIAVAAFTTGSYLDILGVNAWQALFVQGSQLLVLPQVLGLFLLGFAVGRAGWVADLAARRSVLRRLAVGGILLGLPLNLGAALAGPLGIDGPRAAEVAIEPGIAVLTAVAQTIGAPVLAVGYLSALTLLFLRTGAPRLLADLGRVALSGYLLQSLLALVVFAGFSLYGELSTATSLLVVVGIWVVLLAAARVWVAKVGQGPAERLWRRLTYGARS